MTMSEPIQCRPEDKYGYDRKADQGNGAFTKEDSAYTRAIRNHALAVDLLGGALSDLFERLEPFRQPAPEAESKTAATEACCQAVYQIHSLTERVEAQINRVRSVLRELEV